MLCIGKKLLAGSVAMRKPFRGTVDGRNPAPARAYLTIHYNLYPRTPFSMLCSEALCAGEGFQSFNFFVLGAFFLNQC